MSKYKIPDDSEDKNNSTVSPTYFDRRHDIKLDETQRNFGLSASQIAEESKTATKTESFKRTETSSEKAGSTEQLETVCGSKTSKLGEAFAFIKETEVYKSELQKLPDNRKRRMEGSPERSSPTKQTGTKGGGNCLVVSSRQHGNPVVACFRNVAHTFSPDIVPDFVMGEGICALFLSVKYHRLHPNYIYDRIKELGKGYTVKVLLLEVDSPDSSVYIQELSKVAVLSGFTLLLAWSPLEAARYIEAYKIYENKPAEVLQGIKDTSFTGTCNDFLTSIRGVNKTDVMRMRTEFKTVKDIISSDKARLSSIPGIGPKKAARIHDLFRTGFKS